MKQCVILATDGLALAATLFEKENPKALVQIIHGSVEHKERYYEFAQYLNDNGYAVIVSDNRGHGASLNAVYTLGYMDSYEKIVDDQYRISLYFRSIYPDKSLYMLGHSLGSVFARIYLQKHDEEISKLVLSGIVYYNVFTPVGILLTQCIIALSGKRSYNTLLRRLIMNGDDISWVSASKTNLENYRKDPLSGYRYPNESVLTVMKAVRQLAESSHYACENPNLPILFISGAEDPVTGGKRGLKESFDLLKKAGYHNLKNIVYPGMKHEVLNEDDRLIVYKNVLSFFESGIDSGAGVHE